MTNKTDKQCKPEAEAGLSLALALALALAVASASLTWLSELWVESHNHPLCEQGVVVRFNPDSTHAHNSPQSASNPYRYRIPVKASINPYLVAEPREVGERVERVKSDCVLVCALRPRSLEPQLG